MSNHLFVITGGPGSGKTSLVRAMAKAGFRHMPEAGRAIIQDQRAIGGTALPWADRAAFADLMLSWDIRSYREASVGGGPVLLDRGVPDVLGYLTMCGLPAPDYVRKATTLYRYNKMVFIAPHWPAIFSQDSERKQDAAEAEATYRVMAATYTDLGYTLIPLPQANIDERVAFIRTHMDAASAL